MRSSFLATLRISLLVSVLFIVGLLLLGSMFGGTFGTPHQLTLDFIGPLQSTVTKATTGVLALKNDYVGLWNVRMENKRLQALVDKYLAELAKYKEGYSSYLHLEELLEFKEKQDFNPLGVGKIRWCERA